MSPPLISTLVRSRRGVCHLTVATPKTQFAKKMQKCKNEDHRSLRNLYMSKPMFFKMQNFALLIRLKF